MNPFRVEYNGLVLEAGTDNVVNKLDGVDGLPIRVSEDPLTGKDGGNIWARKYDMRTIGIEGEVKGDTIATYFANKNELVRAFGIVDGEYLYITMWDGTTRRILAKVVESPMIVHTLGRNTFNKFRVELKCEDPFFLDEESTIQILYLEDSVGFPVPMPVPSPIPTSQGNVATLNNQGDVAIYPRVRFSNEVENPTLTNTTTGKAFTIETTLVDGEWVDIYVGQDGIVVEKDDGSNYFQYLTGGFFQLEVGNNEISFTASNYSATAEVNIEFSSKYLVI